MPSSSRRVMAIVQRPGERRAEPVGDRLRLDRHDLAPLDGQRHRVGALGLDADDAGARPPCLDRGRDAADEPAAADADHDDVDVRHVVDDLETDRAVAGDDRRVVERVDEREALGVADPLHLGERFADVRRRAGSTRAP